MQKFDLVIKGGCIVTANDQYIADIGINDGKVMCIASNLTDWTEMIDASNKLVLPGGIDIHTHIDAPLHGTQTVDDWYQATVSAACGGVTCVVDYPMQKKGHSLRHILNEWHEKAVNKAIIDYSFSPVIIDLTQEVYKEIPQLIKEGYPTFKVFMAYDFRVSDEEIIKLLDILSSNGGLLGIHAENDWAIGYLAQKMLQEGKVEPRYHAISRPPVSEEEATSRVIKLAKMVNAHIFIVHLSEKGALKEVEAARSKGYPVYAETCPHFLVLDPGLYDLPISEAAKYVVTPPLRTEEHREALWRGLAYGTIATVGSDHCAFPLSEKLRLGTGDFTKIPHGTPGIETRLPVLFSEGVSKGRLSIQKFVEVVSTNPAKIVGLYPSKGTITVGSDADIVIYDPEKESTISQKSLHSKCDFTPFEGLKVKGYPYATISRGNIIYIDGEVLATPGQGKFVKRSSFKPF